MKKIRNRGEDLGEMLRELKVGDETIFDSVSCYDITKVPGGFIYKSDYAGMVFVPDEKKKETVGSIPSSVAKAERPPKAVEK